MNHVYRLTIIDKFNLCYFIYTGDHIFLITFLVHSHTKISHEIMHSHILLIITTLAWNR